MNSVRACQIGSTMAAAYACSGEKLLRANLKVSDVLAAAERQSAVLDEPTRAPLENRSPRVAIAPIHMRGRVLDILRELRNHEVASTCDHVR